jgi:hypothetical protein
VIQHGTSGPGLLLVDERASVEGATFGLGACQMGVGGAGAGSRADGSAGVGAPGTSSATAGASARGEIAGDEDHDHVRACAVNAPGRRGAAGGVWAGAAAFALALGLRWRRRTRARSCDARS